MTEKFKKLVLLLMVMLLTLTINLPTPDSKLIALAEEVTKDSEELEEKEPEIKDITVKYCVGLNIEGVTEINEFYVATNGMQVCDYLGGYEAENTDGTTTFKVKENLVGKCYEFSEVKDSGTNSLIRECLLAEEGDIYLFVAEESNAIVNYNPEYRNKSCSLMLTPITMQPNYNELICNGSKNTSDCNTYLTQKPLWRDNLGLGYKPVGVTDGEMLVKPDVDKLKNYYSLIQNKSKYLKHVGVVHYYYYGSDVYHPKFSGEPDPLIYMPMNYYLYLNNDDVDGYWAFIESPFPFLFKAKEARTKTGPEMYVYPDVQSMQHAIMPIAMNSSFLDPTKKNLNGHSLEGDLKNHIRGQKMISWDKDCGVLTGLPWDNQEDNVSCIYNFYRDVFNKKKTDFFASLDMHSTCEGVEPREVEEGEDTGDGSGNGGGGSGTLIPPPTANITPDNYDAPTTPNPPKAGMNETDVNTNIGTSLGNLTRSDIQQFNAYISNIPKDEVVKVGTNGFAPELVIKIDDDTITSPVVLNSVNLGKQSEKASEWQKFFNGVQSARIYVYNLNTIGGMAPDLERYFTDPTLTAKATKVVNIMDENGLYTLGDLRIKKTGNYILALHAVPKNNKYKPIKKVYVFDVEQESSYSGLPVVNQNTITINDLTTQKGKLNVKHNFSDKFKYIGTNSMQIHANHISTNKNVLVGSVANGLKLYDENLKDVTTSTEVNSKNGLPKGLNPTLQNVKVTKMLSTGIFTLIGTKDKGLIIYNNETQQLTTVINSGNKINSIALQEDKLYVATDGKLLTYKFNNDTGEYFFRKELSNVEIFGSNIKLGEINAVRNYVVINSLSSSSSAKTSIVSIN